MKREETGAAAAVTVLLAVALLTVAGLVIDGGYALATQRRAMNTAEQAARVGADALSDAGLRNGEVVVDPAAARSSAEHYLAAARVSGTVTIIGGDVRVTVRTRQDTTILSAVGIDSLLVTATATATSIDEDSRP